MLNSFDAAVRRAALRRLAGSVAGYPVGANVNMHLHSFFSFNARGHSPARLAYEARRRGLYAAGLCDFDVLDGLEEFLEAGRLLSLRAAVSLETRVFFGEYAAVEINSPGEPGIAYIMGAGFAREPPADSPAGRWLKQLRAMAARRNRALVKHINTRLAFPAIDYRRDVLPLSPAGCPTERHIIRAYCRKTAELGPEKAAARWSDILDRPRAAAAALIRDPTALEEAARARLIKRGGPAYAPPAPRAFPAIDDFIHWVKAARAIPMATWLDGASEGESDPRAILECLRAKGVAAVNIVPERNWNVRGRTRRRLATERLRAFTAAAAAMDLPINIGTEMNRPGQPFYDDLNAPALREFAALFREGARVMVGQTVLARYAGYAYCDERVAADFKGSRRRRNAFFAAVGALPPAAVALPPEGLAPDAALDLIRAAVRRGRRPDAAK